MPERQQKISIERQDFTQRIESNNLTLRSRMKHQARRTSYFSYSAELHEKIIGAFIEKYSFY